MSTTTGDPRPRVRTGPDGVAVLGWRCTGCGYPVAQAVLRCPLCRGPVAESAFSPEGEVWASTCLRVRVPGHTPPYAVAYVVLDDGPRVLVHTPGDRPLPPSTRARVTGTSGTGDLLAVPAGEES
ncbi:hypothetical protein DI005_29680 [Prauserella sp. PE36]|uniref:ChsH2 C-terminal OB-fold domain-containing protein n=1 Tax=Prauserella endophytica TaxID=1592324 RepID=A0ABY2S9S9_9PSEU|nr:MULTISPECIES: OB-fold domain-containing protein [Prauserella]PXY28951.1 hypothetical protein BAY59_14970 [Prauserella coralliicola]RBM14842.1 hypothetical protein DI005_29680 [Prauserella sp. PE36]TKG72637.1 hypothetical protein FCN18_05185 [Prauserella endophytica]